MMILQEKTTGPALIMNQSKQHFQHLHLITLTLFARPFRIVGWQYYLISYLIWLLNLLSMRHWWVFWNALLAYTVIICVLLHFRIFGTSGIFEVLDIEWVTIVEVQCKVVNDLVILYTRQMTWSLHAYARQICTNVNYSSIIYGKFKLFLSFPYHCYPYHVVIGSHIILIR